MSAVIDPRSICRNVLGLFATVRPWRDGIGRLWAVFFSGTIDSTEGRDNALLHAGSQQGSSGGNPIFTVTW
jgi:hypothetical protein